MPAIEIRITATISSQYKESVDESQPFCINEFSPLSAAGILNQLRDMSAIKTYVKKHNIPVNADRLPTIVSPLNDHDEFSISLPCTDGSDQIFLIRISEKK